MVIAMQLLNLKSPQSEFESGGLRRKSVNYNLRKHVGRKPFDEDLEEQLLEWIYERRRVSRKLIMAKAKSMREEKSANGGERKDFNASHGWLAKFMARNGLTLRRKITKAQEDPISSTSLYLTF